ncbi:hypothetical protein B0A50_07808 [Salinomyces thailandicus]|uniref:Uncharacterized protein n=1 Tax=Salinomyces thailandicus TaxID=706561 RepID=A0A4U0TM15_9PEZI|nr:hypothetical protein B0A50_07808 [Salinomyces thailandica]
MAYLEKSPVDPAYVGSMLQSQGRIFAVHRADLCAKSIGLKRLIDQSFKNTITGVLGIAPFDPVTTVHMLVFAIANVYEVTGPGDLARSKSRSFALAVAEANMARLNADLTTTRQLLETRRAQLEEQARQIQNGLQLSLAQAH